jgi:phosphoribosylaminoimidazolecarboxamide formyltransferase / IMP cyclohydrolase
MSKISSAIISVFDKRGLTAFVSELDKMGVSIYSTGGTHKMISSEGINATKIEDYTGFPEMMDGRVKTMHPKIAGGILACRNDEKHMKSAEDHGIKMFDMVVVNLYPFKNTVEKGGEMADIIENIDIGGPTLIRSAAKNFKDVVVITSHEDYAAVIEEMKNNGGAVSIETKFRLATKAFTHTALYDGYISSYFSKINHTGSVLNEDPGIITLQFTKKETLRYGENPHQKASFYVDNSGITGTVASARQLHGKQLSFNNYMDLESAKNIVADFDEPAVAIVKHTNPCGAAIGKTLKAAYESALACDPVSAFGSIIAVNKELDAETAMVMKELFVEAVIAPSFNEEALEILKKKKNIRLIETGTFAKKPDMDWELKKVSGGLLIEDADRRIITEKDLQFVTEKKPSAEEIKELLFAQNLVKHVKSNAILLSKNGATVGIGAGQMSRIDALEIAIKKANSPVDGCVLASDAFFPFRDSVDMAARYGIKAIIQPGGSVKDEDSIIACNEYGIAMVFTGIRSFRHL